MIAALIILVAILSGAVTFGVAEIRRLRAERRTYQTAIEDPAAVYTNLLRGTIAMPSRESLLALAGGPEVKYWVRTWKPTQPEQWTEAFGNWPDSDERWRAVWDVLAFHLETELGAGAGIAADPTAIAQWHGRIQFALFLRSQLLSLRSS